MPLLTGRSSATRSKNIGMLIDEGRPKKQAIAIGYAQQRRSKAPTGLKVTKQNVAGKAS